GTSVQFVKDAMESIMTGRVDPVDDAQLAAEAGTEADGGADTAVRTSHLVRLRQPMAGAVIPLSEVPDPTFAQEIMGPGVAIEPTDGEVVAPAAGTVGHVFPTGHAVALVLEDGVELLIHVGVDTVQMKGEGFTTLVEAGQKVSAGTPLLRADLSAIRVAGHPAVTPILVMNDKDARIELV
ncbi:MAG: PTS sugar transporter subunit IIA, partial [Brachybacterium tyrofermentans]